MYMYVEMSTSGPTEDLPSALRTSEAKCLARAEACKGISAPFPTKRVLAGMSYREERTIPNSVEPIHCRDFRKFGDLSLASTRAACMRSWQGTGADM